MTDEDEDNDFFGDRLSVVPREGVLMTNTESRQ